MKRLTSVFLAMLLACAASAGAEGRYDQARDAALAYLSNRLTSLQECLYVYQDFDRTENAFTQKAKMWGFDETLVKDMDENWREAPYAGDSCIRCQIDTYAGDWGGWLFLNGYLPKGETVPRLNQGLEPGQGMDLTGAMELRFWARGETGNEKIEFFCLGFGYHGDTGRPMADYPDSAEKETLGFIRLSREWAEYRIPLDGLDLSNIACGFGFVASGEDGNRQNVFYLDEIRYCGAAEALENAPIFLRSYETENRYIRNAAFSYDNALTALAFLSAGKEGEAKRILDAFVYAVENDRATPGRVRNAYAAGNIRPFPGWESGARLPGWYDPDKGEYFEDQYQVGSNVGNTSYVALALLQYDALYGSEKYRAVAAGLMDWVLDTCEDGTPGFTAGFDGWDEGEKPTIFRFTYKSVEHNIDAYAAFNRLYQLTGKARYRAAGESCLAFIDAMYDGEQRYFYTGTGDDGVTPNKGIVVLDALVWSALALGPEGFVPYRAALDTAAAMRVEDGGYPFCAANENGGWWAEGTAFTALTFRLYGMEDEAEAALAALCTLQREDGVFPAATVDDLSTGFSLFTGDPWLYGTDAHIAPTAWFVMAVNGWNPYGFTR